MTKKEFNLTLRLFYSCGGPRADKETLSDWFELLHKLDAKNFKRAIVDICETETELGFINLVAEVKRRCNAYKKERAISTGWKEQVEIPEADRIPVSKLQEYVKDFARQKWGESERGINAK